MSLIRKASRSFSKAGAIGYLFATSLHASPLIEAAHRDDLKQVIAHLESGSSASEANRYGVTPLSLACQNGNAEMVKTLLKAGADPNVALPGKETPLHTASRTGVLASVQALIKAGAKVNVVEKNQQSPLMWAAAEGHFEVVRELIDHKAEFKKALKSGYTPLLFAVRQGHLDVVNLLIEKGADVTAASKLQRRIKKAMSNGTAPLILAIENGHFDLAASLLTAGADPNDLRSGFGPLHVITWVRKSVKGDGDNGLPTPKGSGKMTSLEMAQVLVKHGADPNLRLTKGGSGVAKVGRKGATPFLLASETADLPLMKMLIQLGADPTLSNQGRTTPLLAAAGMGVTAPGEEAADLKSALEVVKFLVAGGADINVKDARGESVMHAAAYKSAPEMMALLDELGADVKVWHQKNKSGWTPLKITQGYRPGNFRPIETSELALLEIMNKYGVGKK